MDYIIFIAIVVVAVLAILFWPKKRKGTPDHEDDFDTKKKQNSTKQHELKAQKRNLSRNRHKKQINQVRKT